MRQPYAIVRRPEALFDDEQLSARGFFAEVEHPELGRSFRYPGAPYRFTSAGIGPRLPPVMLGEHNDHVWRDLVGLDDEEY